MGRLTVAEPVSSPTSTSVAAALSTARDRTLALVDALSAEDQCRQQSPLMSPLVWDLAHVGNYEEIWLQRALGGAPAEHPGYDDLYDAFRHPRADRPSLPILGPDEARAYVAGVRHRVLELLDRTEFRGDDRLLDRGFVYGMVIQHEHQHAETMAATRQLMGDRATAPAGATPAPHDGPEPSGLTVDVVVPGGQVVIGTDLEPWAYDNERPAHVVDVAPFRMDVVPVTNGRYLEFIDAGGYDEPRWWTPAGWAWRGEAGLEAPQFWERSADGGWTLLRFGERLAVADDEPVQHVCWYEADAYARWAGKRLPTEEEWECAASWDPASGTGRRYPWGADEPSTTTANLGQRHTGPAGVGSYPGGVSPAGCHQMIGDVWEWTASDFRPYPGFESFPYREYSEVFWGSEYKVLRGGSWATDAVAVRNSFRNWDYPIRRQIFAGFRCAADVDGTPGR